MKVVLDIKNDRDWAVLLPLIQHLGIKISEMTGKSFIDWNRSNTETKPLKNKNFNIDEIEKLINQVTNLGVFKNIEDPVAWQKTIRDEWE